MGTISLTKKGESKKISLSKGVKNEITANLNWNGVIEVPGLFFKKRVTADLDLACMYKLKNGRKGVIQALGNSFGSKTEMPFIMLDGDDRTGSSDAGETMFFTKPDEIELAVIFAYIYEGTANWDKTGAKITLKQPNQEDIVIDIDRISVPKKFCVIATMQANGDDLNVSRVEEFFNAHREVDAKYGFGFNWTAGKK